MKDMFTIIIPTRNRHQYLKRAVDYYSSFQDISIIICDSSANRFENADVLPKNFQYLHVPGNTFAQKIASTSECITTPYVLMSADDDFITLQGIEKSIQFLEANRDYSSAQGHYIAYYYVSGRIHYIPLYTAGIGLDIHNKDIKERVSRYFGSGVQMYYCVHRTEFFKEIFRTMDRQIFNMNLIEYYIGLATLINGKHQVLPEFYASRELLRNSSGKSAGINEISVDPKFAREYDAFLQHTSAHLAMKTHTSVEEAGEFLKQVIQTYINSASSKTFYGKRKRSNRIKKLAPSFIRKGISKMIFAMNAKKNIQANIDLANKYPGFPFNHEEGKKELERMNAIILKHHIVE